LKNSLTKFLISTLLFSAALAGVAFILSKATAIIHPHIYIILLYFFIVTMMFHLGLVASLKGRPQQFIRYFMGATTLKLLVHIAAVIIFALLNKADAINFILSFFVVYIVFTVYEVRFALKLNKTTIG
jgi:hypothetical protein